MTIGPIPVASEKKHCVTALFQTFPRLINVDERNVKEVFLLEDLVCKLYETNEPERCDLNVFKL